MQIKLFVISFLQKTMQLFIRGTQTHVVQVNGAETVEDVKVCVFPLPNNFFIPVY
jgi:hypothetical protein